MTLTETIYLSGFPRHCMIIGEVAQAHDGSLGMAHAYIDAVARAGADAIKFQTHLAEAESTPAEPWRERFSLQDDTRYAYWKRMEFTEAQWRGLKEHADRAGLLFLSSPFSVEAADLLQRIGVAAWKIASGEASNLLLFERIARAGLPVLLSTGLSPMAEIDSAVTQARSAGLPVAVLQCTSLYPTPPEKVGLNMISLFRERYACAVGLSDHSGTIAPGIAAVALGASLIEVHVTLSREMFGPDVAASVTTAELAQLVQGIRVIERALASPVEKDMIAAELSGVRRLFTHSVTARTDLPAGTVLHRGHLTLKKPGIGVPGSRLGEMIGRRLRRPLGRDDFVKEEDLQ
jgi:N-acetylneuraminate synthase